MFTDKIMAVLHPVGHEHKSWTLVCLYNEVPKRNIEALYRAVLSMDSFSQMSGTIPEIGEIVDMPMIALGPTTIMLIGQTWLAILEAYVPENGDSDVC